MSCPSSWDTVFTPFLPIIIKTSKKSICHHASKYKRMFLSITKKGNHSSQSWISSEDIHWGMIRHFFLTLFVTTPFRSSVQNDTRDYRPGNWEPPHCVRQSFVFPFLETFPMDFWLWLLFLVGTMVLLLVNHRSWATLIGLAVSPRLVRDWFVIPWWVSRELRWVDRLCCSLTESLGLITC